MQDLESGEKVRIRVLVWWVGVVLSHSQLARVNEIILKSYKLRCVCKHATSSLDSHQCKSQKEGTGTCKHSLGSLAQVYQCLSPLNALITNVATSGLVTKGSIPTVLAATKYLK